MPIGLKVLWFVSGVIGRGDIGLGNQEEPDCEHSLLWRVAVVGRVGVAGQLWRQEINYAGTDAKEAKRRKEKERKNR